MQRKTCVPEAHPNRLESLEARVLLSTTTHVDLMNYLPLGYEYNWDYTVVNLEPGKTGQLRASSSSLDDGFLWVLDYDTENSGYRSIQEVRFQDGYFEIDSQNAGDGSGVYLDYDYDDANLPGDQPMRLMPDEIIVGQQYDYAGLIDGSALVVGIPTHYPLTGTVTGQITVLPEQKLTLNNGTTYTVIPLSWTSTTTVTVPELDITDLSETTSEMWYLAEDVGIVAMELFSEGELAYRLELDSHNVPPPPYQLRDGVLNITGSDESDDIAIAIADGRVTITVNDYSKRLDCDLVNRIELIGGSGVDTLIFQADANQREHAIMYREGFGSISSPGLEVSYRDFQFTQAHGQSGDFAELYDGPGDDKFIAYSPNQQSPASKLGAITMSEGLPSAIETTGFGQVNAYAIHGGNDHALMQRADVTSQFRSFSTFIDRTSSDGNYQYASGFELTNIAGIPGDTVTLYDTPYDDHLKVTTNASDHISLVMTSPGLARVASGYQTHLIMQHLDSYDTLDIYPRVGSQRIIFATNQATIETSRDSFYTITGFDRMNAFYSHHAKVVEFHDTPGDDYFYGYDGFSGMTSPNQSVYAQGFHTVRSFANQGGYDFAELYDSTQNDHVRTFENFTELKHGSIYRHAAGFEKTNVYSVNGGEDFVEFYDTPGNDHFYSFAQFSAMNSSNGLQRYASGFDRVNAYAIYGGQDFAEFYDTLGNDAFRSFETFSDMTSTGSVELYRYVSGFDQVNAYANHGGSGGVDLAMLYDTNGRDDFYGNGQFGQLYSPDRQRLVYASGFAAMTIDGSGAGLNTRRINALGYSLSEVGIWS